MRVPLGHEHVRGQPLFALQTPQRAYLVAPASGGHSASRIVHVVANKPRAICFGSPSPPQPKKIYSLSGLPSTAAGIFLACLLHAHILPPRMSGCSTSTLILRSPCRRSRCASLVGHN